MLASNGLNNTKQFTINPAKLTFNAIPLFNDKLLDLISRLQFDITLDIFDSNEFDIHKPVIIFIHGNSASKNVFRDQIEYYSGQFRVIAIDLIGHGCSTKIGESNSLSPDEASQLSNMFYRIETMISCINQMLASKRVEKAHLIGWSLGGHIAYGLAIENPSLVTSVTTIGSPPILFSITGLEKGLHEWFVKKLVPEWISSPQHYSHQEARELALQMGLQPNDEHFIDDIITSDPLMRKHLFLGLHEYDAIEYNGSALDGEHFVKTTNLPLCLMVGDRDRGIRADYIKEFQNKLSNPASRVCIIKDAPHAVFKTHQQLVHNIIDDFICR